MSISQNAIDTKWEDDAKLLQFSQAETVRTAAQTWTGYITGLLAVVGFAGVSFVPSEIKEVTGSAHDLVLWLGVAVIVLGLIALLLASFASGALPVAIYDDGDAYRIASEKAAAKGLKQLTASRWFTFGALTCLLLAAALSAINPGQPAPTPTLAIATQSDGKVFCGPTVTNKTTGNVSVKGISASQGIANLTVVEKCP